MSDGKVTALPVAVAQDDGAPLPVRYRAAVSALQAAERIDECREWESRAEALRSYARQARDETLLAMAQRIKARAVRRAGELLGQIEPARGGDRRSDQTVGAHGLISRTDAARDAGMSEHAHRAALRVAALPADDFERQVESDTPPTVTALADQGRAHRPRPPAPPECGGDDLSDAEADAALQLIVRRLDDAMVDPALLDGQPGAAMRAAWARAPEARRAVLRRVRRFIERLEG